MTDDGSSLARFFKIVTSSEVLDVRNKQVGSEQVSGQLASQYYIIVRLLISVCDIVYRARRNVLTFQIIISIRLGTGAGFLLNIY